MDTSTGSTYDSRRTVAATFPNPADAEKAILELKEAGWVDADIGVLMRDRDEQGQIVHETGGSLAAEGAATGFIGGGLIGGIVGIMVGLSAAAIPGVGPVIAGGILGATLTGAGVGAAAGGLVGGLVGLGIPEEEAVYYERGFEQGHVVLAVQANGRASEAANIMDRNGGDLGPSYTAADRNAGLY
jgi:hypothetical protein